MYGKREFGDYQTPLDFADKVCFYLRDYCHVSPSAVIEPTCGIGNFLISSMVFNAKEYYGIEINPEYCEICKKNVDTNKVKIINSDFFSFQTRDLILDKRQILIIGNPPWVTNSMLSSLNSDNLPIKRNFKGISGIDALTGTSNFDICEYIILQLINEHKNTNTVICMLCKTSVARNIFHELMREQLNFSKCYILNFNASSIFGINASACVLLVHLSDGKICSNVCNVYNLDNPSVIQAQYRYLNGKITKILQHDYNNYDGKCCFEWRQGVKHDCSKIMELVKDNDVYVNGKNDTVNIEDDIVYPLIKSSMFKYPIIHNFSKFVIVTQKKVREQTEYIKHQMPKTWKYLNDNIEFFQKRKSSIYKGAPCFSMFGVGEYSYSVYKVGISGFYKQPLFSVLYSDNKKPVMTDDTSYFICFDNYDMAYVAMLLLNSQKVRHFLMTISFTDAKRPYTKKVLERLDFNKIIDSLTLNELYETERELKLNNVITEIMYQSFKSIIRNKN